MLTGGLVFILCIFLYSSIHVFSVVSIMKLQVCCTCEAYKGQLIVAATMQSFLIPSWTEMASDRKDKVEPVSIGCSKRVVKIRSYMSYKIEKALAFNG